MLETRGRPQLEMRGGGGGKFRLNRIKCDGVVRNIPFSQSLVSKELRGNLGPLLVDHHFFNS